MNILDALDCCDELIFIEEEEKWSVFRPLWKGRAFLGTLPKKEGESSFSLYCRGMELVSKEPCL